MVSVSRLVLPVQVRVGGIVVVHAPDLGDGALDAHRLSETLEHAVFNFRGLSFCLPTTHGRRCVGCVSIQAEWGDEGGSWLGRRTKRFGSCCFFLSAAE